MFNILHTFSTYIAMQIAMVDVMPGRGSSWNVAQVMMQRIPRMVTFGIVTSGMLV